jgi:hypothetical protein
MRSRQKKGVLFSVVVQIAVVFLALLCENADYY